MVKQPIALLLLAALQGAPYLLDLVGKPRSSDEDYLSVAVSERADRLPIFGITADTAPAPALPFGIEQVQFDQSAYDIGNAFTVEVSLRYLGSEPITFPSSTETHLFRRSMPGFRVAALSVSIEHADLGHQAQIAEKLYGADVIPGSLIQLTANQVIRIRTQGLWRLPSQKPFGTVTWPLTVTPTVDFNLYGTTYSHRSVSLVSNSQVVLSRAQ